MEINLEDLHAHFNNDNDCCGSMLRANNIYKFCRHRETCDTCIFDRRIITVQTIEHKLNKLNIK